LGIWDFKIYREPGGWDNLAFQMGFKLGRSLRGKDFSTEGTYFPRPKRRGRNSIIFTLLLGGKVLWKGLLRT